MKLRMILNSLSCLPPTTNTTSCLRSSIMERHLLTKPCDRSRGPPFTQPTSCELHPTFRTWWWQTPKKKKLVRGPQSSDVPSRSSEGTIRGETPPQISLTPHHDRSKASYSLMDTLLNRTSYKGWSLSMKTVPSAPHLPTPPLWYWTPNPSSLPTLTSSYPHEPACCTQYTQDHLHPPMKRTKTSEAITTHAHLSPKPCHNLGSSLETSGSTTCKDWNPWSTTPY